MRVSIRPVDVMRDTHTQILTYAYTSRRLFRTFNVHMSVCMCCERGGEGRRRHKVSQLTLTFLS